MGSPYLPLHPTVEQIAQYYSDRLKQYDRKSGDLGVATTQEVVNYLYIHDKAQAYIRSLPESDNTVVRRYLNNTFSHINNALCTLSFQKAEGYAMPDTITLLRLFSEVPPTTQGLVVWRGIGAIGGRREGARYTSQKNDPARLACGLMSTSLSKRVAVNFTSPTNNCCLMRVFVPPGTPMMPISTAYIDEKKEWTRGEFLNQCELLLPPGSVQALRGPPPFEAFQYSVEFATPVSFVDYVYTPENLEAYTARIAALPDIQNYYLRMSMDEYDYWDYIYPVAQEIGMRLGALGTALAIPYNDYSNPETGDVNMDLYNRIVDAVDTQVLRDVRRLYEDNVIRRLYVLENEEEYAAPSIEFDFNPIVLRILVDHLVTPLPPIAEVRERHKRF